MTRFPRLAAAAALALTIAACSSDEKGSTTTAPAPETTAAATTAPATTTPDTATRGTADTVPASVASGPVQIDVVVGVDSGPDRVEHVAVGSEITLNITNPNAADEFHVHGIDLEQAVDQNVMATFNFTADTPGTYEVESHKTEDVLVVIEVS